MYFHHNRIKANVFLQFSSLALFICILWICFFPPYQFILRKVQSHSEENNSEQHTKIKLVLKHILMEIPVGQQQSIHLICHNVWITAANNKNKQKVVIKHAFRMGEKEQKITLITQEVTNASKLKFAFYSHRNNKSAKLKLYFMQISKIYITRTSLLWLFQSFTWYHLKLVFIFF